MRGNKLTDLQHIILLMIRDGRDYELSKKWTKQIESVEKLGLIQNKPNIEGELMLTIKGQECLMKGVMIKYPLHSKGDVGSYNEVISSMNDGARNALLCAMMNERAFDNIQKDTARTFGQHLLDIGFYKKWGSILIGKWLQTTKSSIRFFNSMDKKYERKN